jgi:hypothetical protein
VGASPLFGMGAATFVGAFRTGFAAAAAF